MKFWPKTIVSWREPEAFRATEDARGATKPTFWLRPLCIVILTALAVPAWFVAHLDPHKHIANFTVWLPMFVGLMLFLFYCLPALLRLTPGSVTLYDRAIIKMGWQQMRPLRNWTQFAWYCEGTYYVLDLITAKGARWRFGVPDPALREKILPILRQNGLTEDAAQPLPASPRRI